MGAPAAGGNEVWVIFAIFDNSIFMHISGQSSYFKAITLQLKAFEIRLKHTK